jgi:hypothetical protein
MREKNILTKYEKILHAFRGLVIGNNITLNNISTKVSQIIERT